MRKRLTQKGNFGFKTRSWNLYYQVLWNNTPSMNFTCDIFNLNPLILISPSIIIKTNNLLEKLKSPTELLVFPCQNDFSHILWCNRLCQWGENKLQMCDQNMTPEVKKKCHLPTRKLYCVLIKKNEWWVQCRDKKQDMIGWWVSCTRKKW